MKKERYYIGIYNNEKRERIVCVAESKDNGMSFRHIGEESKAFEVKVLSLLYKTLSEIKREAFENLEIHIEKGYESLCKIAVAMVDLRATLVIEDEGSECSGVSIKNICGSFSIEYRAFEIGAYLYQNCESTSKSFSRKE